MGFESMDAAARHLIFHASIVLLYGLLCGVPYGRSIGRKPEQVVHSWRVAHLSLPLGATLMLAVAGILSGLAVGAPIKWLIAVSLIVSSYAFCVSLTLAPLVGHRGLSAEGPRAARLVYAGNIIGALTSAVAAGALIFAAYSSL